MAKPRYFTGLDIGSSAVKMLIAEQRTSEEQMEILARIAKPVSGMRRGVIIDAEKVAGAISSALRECLEVYNIKVEDVYVNVNGRHIFTNLSHGLASVSRADRRISPEDVDRVTQNAQAFSLPLNEEILEVSAKEYTVDGAKGIREPVGMQGVRIEADILTIGGFSPYLKGLNQAVLGADLEMSGRVVSPIAASHAVLTSEEKEMGVAVLDIGAGTSGLVVFEEGNLIHLAIIPIGSNNITSDIAIGLTTDMETAERIKIEYGGIALRKTDKKQIRITNSEDKSETGLVFSRKFLTDIVETRWKEIFEQVNKELKNISKAGKLPMGLILTGGGASMAGVCELARKELKLPCRLGVIKGFSSSIEDPSWAVASGLALIGSEEEGEDSSPSALKTNIKGLLKKLSSIFVP
ncbi:MAG: cell division protein FtsA [bacterium]